MDKISHILSSSETAEIAADLAEIAEPSLKEFKTTEYIVNHLKALGLEPIKTKDTGCFGTIDLGADKTIALRADIDALPANEEKTIYKHLCGHNINTTVLLATLTHIVKSEEKPTVNIRYIFQPAEELVNGANIMIQAGCLEGVDEIYACHTEPEIKSGQIGIKKGATMAGSNHFKIIFRGASTHAAYPHLGQDIVTAAANYIMDVQTIITRFKDPTLPGLISFGSIHGGHAANLLPDKLVVEGTFRHFHKEVYETIKEKMKAVLDNMENTYGIKGELLIYDGTPPVYNNETLAESAESILKSAGFDVIPYNKMSMGGEDFAFYMKKVPGVFVWVGSAESENHPPLHNEKYFVSDQAVHTACSAWVNLIYNIGG